MSRYYNIFDRLINIFVPALSPITVLWLVAQRRDRNAVLRPVLKTPNVETCGIRTYAIASKDILAKIVQIVSTILNDK